MAETGDRAPTGRRIAWVAGAAVVAIGVGFVVVALRPFAFLVPSADDDRRPPPRVEVAKAERRSIESSVTSTGTLVAPESIVVTTEARGRVQSIRFEEGTAVSSGDVLIVLDRGNEAARVEDARARTQEAERELRRQEALAEQDIASEARLDRARTEEARARARLESASKDLADRTVEAPFDGITGRRLVSPGALLEPGDAVTTLVEVRALDLLFFVPDKFVPRVHEGLRVRARSPAYPDRAFAGRITFVGTEVDPATRGLPLEATLPNGEGRLTPGMFMEVELVLARRDAITIPEAALVTRGPSSAVYVVDTQSIAHREPVEPGVRRSGWVEIVDGVAAEQPVVVAGLQRVRDGAPVRTGADESPPGPSAAGPSRTKREDPSIASEGRTDRAGR
ncbi:MAG: efflux RND transporter periplasmic adaptor subunit [Myxococcota bacterium]